MSYNIVDQSTGERKQVAGSTLTAIYADSPIGVILPYGGDTAPTGYLICDGSAVSRTTYADLYAVIDTKYGEGDGSTTFNLPDAEAGAELYPSADVGSGIAGSVYIIKAVKTALPSDIQAELDSKQDVLAEGDGIDIDFNNEIRVKHDSSLKFDTQGNLGVIDSNFTALGTLVATPGTTVTQTFNVSVNEYRFLLFAYAWNGTTPPNSVVEQLIPTAIAKTGFTQVHLYNPVTTVNDYINLMVAEDGESFELTCSAAVAAATYQAMLFGIK